MYSFKQFLAEQENHFTLDDVIRDCSDFLKQCGGRPLFRGIKPAPNGRITLQHTRTDRVPRDLNPVLSKYLDDAIEKVVGFKTRSAGTFASGSSVIAGEYGSICLVFPKNGFKFAWSPEIKDPFVNFEIDVETGAVQKAKEELIKKYTDMGKTGAVTLLQNGRGSRIIQAAADFAENGDPEIMIALADRIASAYRFDDLEGAIKSGNEIIFNGDYYAIPEGASQVLSGAAISPSQFMDRLITKV